MEKKDIYFIRHKLKKDYVYDGIVEYGFKICVPYIGNAFVPRLFREFWFRCRLPLKQLWYNKEIKGITQKIIIVEDPIITEDFLKWLRKKHSDKYIILNYENRAKTTINPMIAGQYVDEMWSYDRDDCVEFGMKNIPPNIAFVIKDFIKGPIEQDVLFVGRDKGRLEYLKKIKNTFDNLGLKTLLYICANRRFLRYKNKEYKPVLDYEEYLKLLGRSKANLNIMPEGQTSITQRDLETVAFGIKEITNNKDIKKFSLYDPSRFFVLGEDDIDCLTDFVNSEFKPIEANELNQFKLDTVINIMLKNSKQEK